MAIAKASQKLLPETTKTKKADTSKEDKKQSKSKKVKTEESQSGADGEEKVLMEVPSKADNVETVKTEDTTSEEEAPNPVSVYVNKLNNYVERLGAMNKELKEMVSIGKTLEKDFTNIVKVLSKKNKKSSDRPKSGFAMPSLLSNELYKFMGITHGELVNRTDVTRKLNEYIKANNLRREDNKRYIIPDKLLQKLLRSEPKDEITYFNLQHFMKHHYVKELEATA
jgi:chromatin remodeling complex protein RSC6